MGRESSFRAQVRSIYRLLSVIFTLCVLTGGGLILLVLKPYSSNMDSAAYEDVIPEEEVVNDNLIENGIHVRTGLVEAEGLMEVVNNCTPCHSAKLVIQNRMNRERWNATIRWMQETQNLWDLGKNQEIIVNYLVTNYPPKKKGRREILTDIEWYELTD